MPHRRKIVHLRTFFDCRRAIIKAAEAARLDYKEVLILLAIRLSMYEGRPIDTTGVAMITGLKFSSCHRHLKHLEKIGQIKSVRDGKRVVHTRTVPEPTETIPMYYEINRAFRRAAKELIGLD